MKTRFEDLQALVEKLSAGDLKGALDTIAASKGFSEDYRKHVANREFADNSPMLIGALMRAAGIKRFVLTEEEALKIEKNKSGVLFTVDRENRKVTIDLFEGEGGAEKAKEAISKEVGVKVEDIPNLNEPAATARPKKVDLHPIAKDMKEHWEEVISLVMFKAGLTSIELTGEDADRLLDAQKGFAVMSRPGGGEIKLALVDQRDVAKLKAGELSIDGERVTLATHLH